MIFYRLLLYFIQRLQLVPIVSVEDTAHLAASQANRMRLNRAIEDIRAGKFEGHALIDA